MAIGQDILKDYLLGVEKNEFTSICDRLLAALFPAGSEFRGSFFDNELILIDATAFTVFFPYSDDTFFRPPSAVLPGACSSLIVLSPNNHIFDDSSGTIRENINNYIGSASVSVWSVNTISTRIHELQENQQIIVLGTYSPIVRYHSPAFSIKALMKEYNATAEHVTAHVGNGIDRTEAKDFKYEKTVSIRKKLDFNFSRVQESFSQAYINCFEHYYAFSKLVEFISINHNNMFVLNWQHIVQNELVQITGQRSPNYPIVDNQFDRLIAKLKSYFNNTLYSVSSATGIAIYFFERCAIGARNEEDKIMDDNRMFDQLELFQEEK